jgi:hypothetical protein
MTTLTAQMMDGEFFEVAVPEPHAERVGSIKEKLALVSGVPYGQITLMFEGTLLAEEDSLDAVFENDEPVVVFIRAQNADTRMLAAYDIWVESSQAVQGDGHFKDSAARMRLGVSLMVLGEYDVSWMAFKEGASIAQYPAKVSDEDLLQDPGVGKYARSLDRAWKRRKNVLDETRSLVLLKLLRNSGRQCCQVITLQ